MGGSLKGLASGSDVASSAIISSGQTQTDGGVDIARRVGVTQATVANRVARLRREGLVEAEPYRSVFLTEEGRLRAERCRRRHEVVLAFLRFIGVGEEAARCDAEGIEHHVGEETLAAFERLMRTGRK